MKPTLILLLFLWDSVEFVLTHEECSQLPSVDRAFVPDEYKKVQYQIRDVIYFSCDPGYTTGFNASYVCTELGWRAATYGQCVEKGTFSLLLGCTPPPALKNAHALNNSSYFYEDGKKVAYRCDQPYTMTGGSHKTCSNGQWTGDLECHNTCDVALLRDSLLGYRNVRQYRTRESFQPRCKERSHVLSSTARVTCLENGQWSPLPSCTEISCELPAPNPNLRIFGAVDRVAAGDRITVQCVTGGRSELVECLPSGTWSSTFPTCREISCELPAPNPNLRISGAVGDRVAAGDRITVQCVTGGRSEQVECLPSGTWSSTFPTCRDTCDVALLRDSLLGYRNVRQYRTRESFQPRCKERSHVLSSTARVTCLENGQWSPLPSCTDGSCGSPPSLDNGDFIATGTRFRHNTWVEYQCQNKYKRHGESHKTCFNGEWIGEITCLKPCTINPDLLVPNKIQFRYAFNNQVYAPHDDYISFVCVDGATPESNGGMRRQCVDGVMELPRCV